MSDGRLLAKAQGLLASVSGRALSLEERRDKAIDLAAWLLVESRNRLTSTERNVQAQLAGMMKDIHGKIFTTSMTDQCFRSDRPARVADQIVYLLNEYGVPKFLPFETRWKLSLFKFFGRIFPRFLVPAARFVVRREMRRVIIPGEPERLSRHLKRRHRAGVRINLNHIGEAILGEEEAERRTQIYLDSLADPGVEYVSIKISTICSQINLLAWDQTLNILSERLRKLYRVAASSRYTRPDGSVVPKFVNLDMEEYRDLRLTVELFRRVLDEPEFFQHQAGIVLQAYLPDSNLILQELTVWAMKRIANGGTPIKVRLVKGANLAMERVESSIGGWPQAPYTEKADVDANYKRMLDYACIPEHARAAHLSVGSHNLFDIAYALILREERNVQPYISFEMLEGMADHMRRVIHEVVGDMLLYCPASKGREFVSAVSYLIRRLDENTQEGNFLRHSFDLEPNSPAWEQQAQAFRASCDRVTTVGHQPRRRQSHFATISHLPRDAAFDNEAYSDWATEANLKWAEGIIRKWQGKELPPIPLVIAGEELSGTEKRAGFDPSRPEHVPYHYSLASLEDAERALAAAEEAGHLWAEASVEKRVQIAVQVARLLRERRGDFVGAMVLDGGKTIPEADAELCEAIDFAEYYWRSLVEWTALKDVQWKPKGCVLLTPPWNFPCAIPLGGAIAALLTGNTVLFKPAQETALVGWLVAQVLWDAGVPKDVLQFILCDDTPVGSALIQDPRVSAVILTGGTDTARLFLELRPGLDLMAETGGKNALIVTGMADRDLAAKDLVYSAFGHAGQKCSAASLAIVDAEVYDDPRFFAQLRDAAASWTVGSAWDLKTKINPMIRAPGKTLKKGLQHLAEGEQWLLEPKQVVGNPKLWTPGIKVGVRPDGFTFQNELFGPVLSVVRAENLADAIEMVNSTPYGLTSGINSLDAREVAIWRAGIQAGNCYVNRGITGAIVQRQPFGGMKQSAFGHGFKAGGPHYLLQLMQAKQTGLVGDGADLSVRASGVEEGDLGAETPLGSSLRSYTYWWNEYFSKSHDLTQLIGQDNELVYRAKKGMQVRLCEGDSLLDLQRLVGAAKICGSELTISVPKGFPQGALVYAHEEDAEAFVERINASQACSVRFLQKPSSEVLSMLKVQSFVLAVQANGRIELAYFLQEVSFSTDYHRYGNLGERESEARRPLLEPEVRSE